MQEEASQLAKDMHVLHRHPQPAAQTLRSKHETAQRNVQVKHSQERLMKQARHTRTCLQDTHAHAYKTHTHMPTCVSICIQLHVRVDIHAHVHVQDTHARKTHVLAT